MEAGFEYSYVFQNGWEFSLIQKNNKEEGRLLTTNRIYNDGTGTVDIRRAMEDFLGNSISKLFNSVFKIHSILLFRLAEDVYKRQGLVLPVPVISSR